MWPHQVFEGFEKNEKKNEQIGMILCPRSLAPTSSRGVFTEATNAREVDIDGISRHRLSPFNAHYLTSPEILLPRSFISRTADALNYYSEHIIIIIIINNI